MSSDSKDVGVKTIIPARTARVQSYLRGCVAVALGVAGLALLALNVGVQRDWIDNHFLPVFSMSDAGRIAREIGARVGLALIGISLVAMAWRLRKPVTGERLAAFFASSRRILVAVICALVLSEGLIRVAFPDLFNELRAERRPTRQYDARLGWAHVPGLSEQITFAGRAIDYIMDAAGNRVAARTTSIGDGPTIVIAGESVAMGYRLPWHETMSARIAALSGAEVYNVAVEGYSTSQAYLRLVHELPRVRTPSAVVTVFLPSVFTKVIDPRRPRLSPRLEWIAPQSPARLATLTHWLIPYDGDEKIAEGIETARAVLRATETLAQSRGARSLIVVPQFEPESAGERLVRTRILDDAGIRYLLVPLPDDWRIPGDPHPDERANRRLAEVIVEQLVEGSVGTLN